MARAVQAPIVAATWLGKVLREARATAEARAAAATPAQNDTGASAAVDGATNLLEQGPHLAPSWWADWLPFLAHHRVPGDSIYLGGPRPVAEYEALAASGVQLCSISLYSSVR